MRIVSKFQDYYDSAQGMGIDKSLVYVRQTDCSKDSKPFKIDITIPRFGRWDDTLQSEALIIGFCGKIFPCLKLIIKVEKKSKSGVPITEEVERYVYSYDELKQTLLKHNLKKELDDIEKKDYFWRRSDKKTIIKFFNEKKNNKKFENIFLENKVPIFVIGEGLLIDDNSYSWDYYSKALNIILNAELKTFQFYRQVDAFTAFQEIAMYIGGVIPKDTPEMATISDENMLKKKGFITPESFRHMPDTRKRKQKKGKIKKHD